MKEICRLIVATLLMSGTQAVEVYLNSSSEDQESSGDKVVVLVQTNPTESNNLAEHINSAVYYDLLKRPKTDEDRLVTLLFDDYEPAARPVYNWRTAVGVELGLNLISIADIDEKNQILELVVWLEMEWTDERFRWNPANFSGVKVIRVPSTRVWIPDVILLNSADESDKQYQAELLRAMVDYKGKIFIGPLMKIRSHCMLDLLAYPYDTQTCYIYFGSRSYDSSQVKIVPKLETANLEQYEKSSKWEFVNAKIQASVRYHHCCEHPFSVVSVAVTMQRKFLYNNLFNTFVPTLLLNFLCLLAFHLPAESTEKISLTITLLLTFYYFSLTITEATPPNSDVVPLFTVYITGTLTVAGLVCCLQIFHLQIHTTSAYARPVPKWLRKIIIEGIGRCLGIIPKHFEQTIRQHSAKTWRKGVNFKESRHVRNGNLIIQQLESFRLNLLHSIGQTGIQDDISSISSVRLRFLTRNHFPSYESMSRCSTTTTLNTTAVTDIEHSLIIRIIKSIEALSEREILKQEKSEVATEWQVLAVCIDRLFFWCFLAFTIFITFGLLVAIPVIESSRDHKSTKNMSEIYSSF